VEEYSIDEAFADITGMRRALRASYETIALNMKAEIAKELGITVSVGLSLTKVLAKVASKHQKPNGFTPIPGRMIAKYLEHLPWRRSGASAMPRQTILTRWGSELPWSLPGSRKTPSESVSPNPVWKSGGNSGGVGLFRQSGRKEHLCLHQQDQDLFTSKQRCRVPVCPSDEESGIGLSQGQGLSSGGQTDRGPS